MEKRTNSNKIYDNRNLTLNTLNKRNGNIVRPAVSGRMNPNTVEAYQGMRQLQSRVAM